MADEDAPLSALQANIQEKGKMAYYYAHTTPRTHDGAAATPVTDGPPKLLSVEPVAAEPSSRTRVPITRYSWADGRKAVRVYVPLDALPAPAGGFTADSCTVEWEARRVELRVADGDGSEHHLRLPHLNDDVSAVDVSVKDDGSRATLKLAKASQFTWYDLVKAPPAADGV